MVEPVLIMARMAQKTAGLKGSMVLLALLCLGG